MHGLVSSIISGAFEDWDFFKLSKKLLIKIQLSKIDINLTNLI